jgi:hypothetical protein
MASIGQDEAWAAVRCVLEQIHPSGASHALRNPIISKTEVLNMSVPEFKSKNNVGDSDANVLSNSALCQQIEDMEVKCLKMQKKAVL